MKKVLLVTFSDNADHQDTLFGMYEELRKRSDWDAYLLCIKTPKVELQQSDHTWLVDCPERPGVTKKTFNLPLLLSIIHRIRREHFDTIYFESLHTWNLPIMMMSGKAKTYQVIHEVIPHEGDSQVKMVDLMNKAVVKFADTIVLRNKTYIQDMIDRYGIPGDNFLKAFRICPKYAMEVGFTKVLQLLNIRTYKKYYYNDAATASSKRPIEDDKEWVGAFTGWDNTARRGKNSIVYDGSTPERFEQYLTAQIMKSIRAGQEGIVFINAWNEWAEGAHLEPDERYGLKYLEALKKSKELCNK